jgi:predicted kinase
VAEELAKRLKVPFVSKDTLKERLYEAFGSGEELEQRIDEAALAILFSVVESQLAEGVSVAAESNFDAESDTEPFRRLAAEHDVEIVQIHIDGDTEALVAKFVRRAQSGKRHPGHRDGAGDADELRAKLEAGHWAPLKLPGTLVEADMHDDEEEIVERVRATRVT